MQLPPSPTARPWLLLCATLLAALLTGCGTPPSGPMPVEGVVWLSAADLDRPVALLHGWTARAGIDDATALADDPQAWQPVNIRQLFRQQGFPEEGSVSYRLALRLPEGVQLRGALQHANNAYRLWAVMPGGDRHLLAQSGYVSDVPEEVVLSRRPAVFPLPEARELVLVWQIANADFPQGGPFYPLYIGAEHAIQEAAMQHVMETALLVGFFAALALVALLLWVQDLREPAALALALLALLACVRTLAQSGMLEYLYEPHYDFVARALLETVTLLLLSGGTAFLLWTVMPWAFAPFKTPWGTLAPLERDRVTILRADAPTRVLPLPLRWFNTYAAGAALLAGVGLTLVTLLAPLPLIGRLLPLTLAAFVPLFAVLVLIAAEAAYVRHPLWPFFTLGFLGLAVTAGHDLLVDAGVLLPPVYWLPHGLLAVIVLFCAASITLRVRARRKTERRNEELAQQVSARSKELQTASQAAQAAYLARGQFLTAVSHELRTPLAAIMGYANLLDEELDGQIEPQHREFLLAIAQSGERLLHLIDDLLDLSRIEAGRFALRPGTVDANVLAREVHTQLYPLAREKGLAFEVESRLSDDADTFVTDGTRLRQVLVNLVSNAIKFTHEGSVRLVVDEAMLEERPAFRFRVEDTGMGISPEFISQLFERFTQEARVYGQTQRGTGLGLHLSKELVARMGGTIEVESEVDTGSVFTVTMPLGR